MAFVKKEADNVVKPQQLGRKPVTGERSLRLLRDSFYGARWSQPVHSSPQAHKQSDWRRINYCIFCCGCTFRTIVSVSFVKLGQCDVLSCEARPFVNMRNMLSRLGPHPHRPDVSWRSGPSITTALSTHTQHSFSAVFLIHILVHTIEKGCSFRSVPFPCKITSVFCHFAMLRRVLVIPKSYQQEEVR